MLEDVRDVLHVVSNDLREAFVREVMDKKRYPFVPQQLGSYLKEQKLHLGDFTIFDSSSYNAQQKREWLRNNTESVIVNFQLPEALNQWYQKTQAKTLAPIPWGDIYRSMLDVIWSSLRKTAAEHHLRVERLNFQGEHDSDYYYLWSFHRSTS